MEIHRQEAVARAESRAKELQDSRSSLLACMKEVKVLIDCAFAKGGVDQSDALPEADPVTFSDWLSMEIGDFGELLSGVLDVGAYGAMIGLAYTLRVLGCDHLRSIGRPSHRFLNADSVREAINDGVCKNVVSHFLRRFWEKGGWALSLDVGVCSTQEVIFNSYDFGCGWHMLFLVANVFLIAPATMGLDDLHYRDVF